MAYSATDRTSWSDADCLARSVEDVDAFAEFYDRHSEAILSYCHRRTGCPHTSADLTAEVFAAAFVKRHSFRDRGRPARSWLYGIARRQIGTYSRRRRVANRYRRRFGITDLALADEDFDRVDWLIDFNDVAEQLNNGLEELPSSQRDAVRLRIIDERTYAEVARALNCSEGAARVRVSRGLTGLAHIIGVEQ